MDPLSIAQFVVPLLTPVLPYLTKGVSIVGQEVAKFAENKLSEKAPEFISKLWGKLEARISGNPVAQAAVEKVVANPQDQRAVGNLEMTIEDILKDETFRSEIEKMLEEGKKEGITVEQVTKLGEVLGEFVNIDVENVQDLKDGSTLKSELEAEKLGKGSKSVGVRLGSNKK